MSVDRSNELYGFAETLHDGPCLEGRYLAAVGTESQHEHLVGQSCVVCNRLVGRLKIHPSDVDFMLGIFFFLGVAAGAAIVEIVFKVFL